MSGLDHVIVGGGPAAIEAAASIRATDPVARIRILTDERWRYYARLRLGEVVDGRTEPASLHLRLPAWYDDQRIEVSTAARVEGMDVSSCRVRLANGEWLPYERLLLATGGRPFVPPFPGSDLPGVLTLRAMDDALALREAARSSDSVLVVGGGLLGLEVAASLRGLGARTTVVEAAPWLLSRQVDAGAGQVIRETLEERGISFRLGSGVSSIESVAGGLRALLPDGDAVDASLVVVSAGIRPDVGLARDAGLVVERGIRIDDRLVTSVEGVFAAGDCCEHRGELYGIWPAAVEQGRLAGKSMAGGVVEYGGTLRQTTLKVADLGVFCIGRDVRDGDAEDASRTDHSYRRLVRDPEGRLAGAVLVGDLSERKGVLLAVMAGKPYQNPS